MRFSKPFAALALVAAINVYSIPIHSRQFQRPWIRYPPPSVRGRPSGGYKGHRFDLWKPPPPQHLYGTYHVTHASQAVWVQSLVNLQLDFLPPFIHDGESTSGKAIVQSWSDCAISSDPECNNQDAVETLFGYETPIALQGPTDRRHAATGNFTASGALKEIIGNLSAVLAWGFDYENHGFIVQYSTDSHDRYVSSDRRGGNIQIASRNDRGINKTTLSEILHGLRELGEALEDVEFSTISLHMNVLLHDGRRDGHGPIQCNADCRNNTLVARRYSQSKTTTPIITHKKRNLSSSTGTMQVNRIQKEKVARLHMVWWSWFIVGFVLGGPLLAAIFTVITGLIRSHRRQKKAACIGISSCSSTMSTTTPVTHDERV